MAGLWGAFTSFVSGTVSAVKNTVSRIATRSVTSMASEAMQVIMTSENLEKAIKSEAGDKVVSGVILVIMWHIWLTYFVPLILAKGFCVALVFSIYYYGWLGRFRARFFRGLTLFLEVLLYCCWKVWKALLALVEYAYASGNAEGYGKLRGYGYSPLVFDSHDVH
ncbi:RND transporter [Babesia ovata]|uniref:RND transporter n=1 Tax=Babesia ovata TaxID=189622 RepID=A0A2H6K962_9APIC|nr:RND transporter [Babesia ovata]GBE59520.1 RND transporter [Babesia ovata]